MLKITIEDGDPTVRFVIEGTLGGPWVEELRRCWSEILRTRSSRALLVDLTGITFIDLDGRALLEEMHRQGAHLAAVGLMTQAIIEEITH